MFLGLGSSTTLLAPTVSSASVMAALASGCRSPTMAGTLTCLGPLLTVSVTAEPSCTSVPAAGSVLTAWPAGMVALVFCSVAAHHEAGGRDGGVGVGLGEALDLGHEGERRTGAHGVVHRAAGGHDAVGRRILGEDGVLGAGVLDHAAGADRELGGRDGGLGVGLQEPHDGGHADLLGTLADGERDGRAELHLGARGGLGLDGLAGGDGGVGLLLGGRPPRGRRPRWWRWRRPRRGP